MTVYLWTTITGQFCLPVDKEAGAFFSEQTIESKKRFIEAEKTLVFRSNERPLTRYLDNRNCYQVHLISQYAVDVLKDIWDKYADLYPVHLADAEELFYVVIPKLYLDCLDKEKSNIGISLGNPCDIREWVIKPELIGNAPIFSIDIGNPNKIELQFQDYFVTEEFVQRVKDADLEGFSFTRSFRDFDPIKTKAKKPRVIMPSIGKLKAKEITTMTDEALSIIAEGNLMQSDQSAKLDAINDKFLNRAIKHKQFEESLTFMDAQLKAIVPEPYYSQIKAIDLSTFPAEFLALYEKSLADAKKDKSVEALYFEYYYDGHPDVSNGNMFLCQTYDDNDFEWACNFENLTEGMSMCPYFDPIYKIFHDDLEIENDAVYISQSCQYIHISLLLMAYQHLKEQYPKKLKYPLAFGSHDYPDLTYNCP